MADYSSPKPIDPLWYQRGSWLRITCACGRRDLVRLNDLERRHRIHEDTPIYKVIARLRCRVCKARPSFADVARGPHFG